LELKGSKAVAFENYLNLSATIWRSVGHNINDYGEVCPSDPTSYASTKVRIDPLKGKGLTTMFHGQTVDIQNRIFALSNIDINEGDIIKIDGTSEQYEILLIEKLYGKTLLHHFQIMARRTDLL